MKNLLLTLSLVGVILSAACGSAKAPTSPSPAVVVVTPTPPTTPQPPPAPPAAEANIVLFNGGNGQFRACTKDSGDPRPQGTCDFSFSIQNIGPGCASGVRGTVTFLASGGTTLGSHSWAWNVSSGTKMRVGESTSVSALVLPDYYRNQTASYRINPSWTNVAC